MKTTIEITPQGLYFPDTKGIGTPTPEETVLFTEQDIIVDVEGRPIHPDYIRPVSYTHLDVYKRQALARTLRRGNIWCGNP